MTGKQQYRPTSENKVALCDIWLFEKREEEPRLPEYLKDRLKALLQTLITISDDSLPIEPSSLKSSEFFESDFFVSSEQVYSYKSVKSFGLEDLLLMLDDGVFLAALKLRQAKDWTEEQLDKYIYGFLNIDNMEASVFIDNIINRYGLILPENVFNYVSQAIEWRKRHGSQEEFNSVVEHFEKVSMDNSMVFKPKKVPKDSHFSKKAEFKLPLIEGELFSDNFIDEDYNWKLKSAHKKGTPSIIPYLALFVHKLDEYGYFKQRRKNSKMASLFSQRYNLSEKEEISLVNALKANKLASIGKQVKVDIELCFDRINHKHRIV
tara:strand:+ start:913 stop:1875 length:963 start_codon:yes stop_codon:yes gene_type:complete